ncbi:hypothetical protein Lal_00031229 [Lupinus albus]|nr:hypothetical protein Lal_00031229 [Lupinus albus]
MSTGTHGWKRKSNESERSKRPFGSDGGCTATSEPKFAGSKSEPSSKPEFATLGPTRTAEYRGLDEFYRRNPSQFHGGFAPDAAIEWVQGLERIFRAMSCSDAQKLAYATYMLVKEPEN